MNTLVTSPVYGEVSPRLANNIFGDEQLKYGLRKAYNILISRNIEMLSRPPTHDMGSLGVGDTAVARSFQFRFPDGNFTILTFSDLKLEQHLVGSEDSFTAITTNWTEADILKMDGVNYENDMIFVTPEKEPMIFQYDPAGHTFSWATVQSKKAGTTDPPWHATSEWPVSVSFMIGRFVLVSKRHYYGSVAGDVLNWDITTTTEAGDTVVTPSSAFSFNIADDLDSGFEWIRGGEMVFGGSPAGTWMMSNLNTPINTKDPNVKNYSSIGCYNLPSVNITGGHLYFANDGVTAKIFAVGPNGLVNNIVNPYAKHLFEESKPKRMVFMRTPDTIVWILREDGQMVMFAIDDTRRAWSRFETDGTINDIWLGKDDDKEYLYMDVIRGNGRRIERIEETDPLKEYIVADGLSIIESAAAKPIEDYICGEGEDPDATYIIAGHGYTDQQVVKIIGLDSEGYAYVQFLSSNQFWLMREDGSAFKCSLGKNFSVREALKEVTFAQLANKEVDLYNDGYFSVVQADATGKITLDVPGSVLVAGLPYTCYLEPRSFIDLQANFVATVNKIHPRVHETRMILYGPDANNITQKHLIPVDDDSFTGTVQDLAISGGMDFDCTFVVGGTRTPFIMSSCFVDIEVGRT